MADITQTVSTYTGEVPTANSMTQAEFDAAAVSLTNYWVTIPVQLNEFASQANSLKTDLNTIKSDTNDIKDSAISETTVIKEETDAIRLQTDTIKTQTEVVLSNTEAVRDTTLAAANFKGNWTDAAGAATVPASYWHNSTYWMLLQDVANISAIPPSDDSIYWAPIQTLPVVKRPSPTAPLGGATGQVTAPTLSATPYANIYDADLRDYREFEVDVQGGDWSDPVYSFEGDVDGHTIATPLDTLSSYQWRCRDIAVSGEISAWSTVQAFSTADIYVNAPTITSPTDGATNVNLSPTVETDAFTVANGGSDTHLNTDWRILNNATLEVVWESLADATNKLSIDVPEGYLSNNIEHRLQVRYRGNIYGESAWGFITFTPEIYVEAPTITEPTNGATDIGETPTLSTSAFSVANGGSDTHLNTDWRVINNSTLAVVWESLADASNKTSIAVPAGNLVEGTTYRAQAKHRGTIYGESAWSAASTFTTAATFGGIIGTAGGQDFGVGIAPSLPAGFSALTGTTTPGHAEYGNYETTNGSIMVFVPRFYYRIGSASSPNHAAYGNNAIDIAGVDTYADEAAANAAGFALHRAFIDGGNVLDGFFIDKYIASKDGTTSCKSVFGGVPISLTTTTTYTRSDGMTGCTGILADAIVLSRARGTGFHCASLFQYSALALLSLAHGQAAASATYCAWYDAGGTTNFPKGCNNNALADVDDTSVTYTTAGDSGSASKPLAGATANFPRTTHNGQSCGVADLNGSMWQVLIGVTSPGSNATNGNAYVLKESVSCSDLTGGWNGATDVWGDATHLATLYDSITGFFPWGSTTGAVYFGNGANQVFDEALDGTGWLRTGAGVQQDTSAMGASGTALFGQDQCYQYNVTNVCPLGAGYWGSASNAGVFYRIWNYHRSSGSYDFGFRSSLALASGL